MNVVTANNHHQQQQQQQQKKAPSRVVQFSTMDFVGSGSIFIRQHDLSHQSYPNKAVATCKINYLPQ